MRRNKWNWLTMLLLGLILMAYGSPSPGASQSKLNKNELKTLIANAKTPQDHERLAAYYRSQEQLAKSGVAEHEQMLQRYHENPLSHRFTKTPSPDDHCRTMIRLFGDKARHFSALAQYHERLAEDLGQQK